MLDHEGQDADGQLGAHDLLEVEVVAADEVVDIAGVPGGEAPEKKDNCLVQRMISRVGCIINLPSVDDIKKGERRSWKLFSTLSVTERPSPKF